MGWGGMGCGGLGVEGGLGGQRLVGDEARRVRWVQGGGVGEGGG